MEVMGSDQSTRCGGMSTIRRIVGVSFINKVNLLAVEIRHGHAYAAIEINNHNYDFKTAHKLGSDQSTRCGGMSTIRRIVGVSFIAVWNFLSMRDWTESPVVSSSESVEGATAKEDLPNPPTSPVPTTTNNPDQSTRCGGMSTIRRIVGVSFIAVWNFLSMRDWVVESKPPSSGDTARTRVRSDRDQQPQL
jgi:hypothetical protein